LAIPPIYLYNYIYYAIIIAYWKKIISS